MGVKILQDRTDELAALYCSVSDWAFGPVFYPVGPYSASEVAQRFLDKLSMDARRYTDKELETLHVTFLNNPDHEVDEDVSICENCGEPTDDSEDICCNCKRERINEDAMKDDLKNQEIRALNLTNERQG